MKVSIVVPIYKTEKFLRKCVDSILNQTLQDIEVILVDDGSPDACPQICDEYAQKDKRVRVIHQKNQGLGAAYNAGIGLAQGTYLGLVESDDFIEPGMFEALYNEAAKYDADIVKGPYYEYWEKENGEEEKHVFQTLASYTPPQRPFSIDQYPRLLNRHASVWTAIYKMSFINGNNIRFQEQNKGFYADQNWRYETLMQAKTICWLKTPFYNYRLTNPNSTSVCKTNPKDVFDVLTALDNFLQKRPEQVKKVLPYVYLEKYEFLIWNSTRVAPEYKKDCFARIRQAFKKMDYKVISSSGLFSRKDKCTFLMLRWGLYPFFEKLKSWRKKIISVHLSPDKQYRIWHILFFSIRLKRKKH